MSIGPIRRNLREMTEWARETPTARSTASAMIDKPWVRENLARVYAKVQVLRLMNWKQAWAAQRVSRIRPMPRRSRCSAASSTSRRTG